MRYLTRKELYDLVWETPLTAAAKDLGVTPAALAEHCHKAAAPRPAVGYWQRLHAGKAAPHAPLPPRPPGAEAIVKIGWSSSWWRRKSEMLADPAPIAPEFPETLEQLAIRMAEALATPSKTFQQARIRMMKKPEAQPARRKGRADIRPEPSRRHPLLAQLGSLLARVVARPDITEIEDQTFVIDIHAASVRLTLGSLPGGPGKEPLTLRIEPGDRSFADKADARLEAQLQDVALAVLIAAETKYRTHAFAAYEHARHWRQEAEEDARQRHLRAKRLVEQRRRAREQRRRELLFSQADDWRTARDIRGFVAEILASAGPKHINEDLQDWADWALEEADNLDPVKQAALVRPPGSTG